MKSPGGGRKSFAIIKRDAGGSKTLKLEELDAINRQFASGTLLLEEAKVQIKEVIKRLREKSRPKPGLYKDNEILLAKYLDEKYAGRDLADPENPRFRYGRALRALGGLSIYAATQKELMAAAAKAGRGNPQRKIASCLNRLLKFIGRSPIPLDKKRHADVKYISLKDYERVRKYLHGNMLLLSDAALYTGCRLGELFCLTPGSLRSKERAVWVEHQILDTKRGHQKAALKNRKPHLAYVIPEGQKRLNDWLELPFPEKMLVRDLRHADVLSIACQAAFPGDPSKALRFHDLRHSYAIHMVKEGVSLKWVANCLGDSLAVVDEYYAGYQLTPEDIDGIDRVLRPKL